MSNLDIVTATSAVSGFTHGGRGYDFNDIFHSTRVADGFHSLSSDVSNAAKSTELATEKTAAAINLAIEKTAAASALMAVQIESRQALYAADSRAEAAKCCCEIKELVRAEACATRELISRIDSDNAKVALQSATAELLALKYRHKE